MEGGSETMRLQKFLARAGVCSRRGGEKLIAAGRVVINGAVEKNPAAPVNPVADRVDVDGRPVALARPRYLLLNKPTGFVTTADDPRGRATVYDLLPRECRHMTYVGRLDFNTTGVLLFTNDGDLVYRLTRPEFQVDKRYRARVMGRLSGDVTERLLTGVECEGERFRARQVTVVKRVPGGAVLELVLTEGKNREVRRMLEAVGLAVSRLTRVAFAGLTAAGVQPGEWRWLDDREVEILRRAGKG